MLSLEGSAPPKLLPFAKALSVDTLPNPTNKAAIIKTFVIVFQSSIKLAVHHPTATRLAMEL